MASRRDDLDTPTRWRRVLVSIASLVAALAAGVVVSVATASDSSAVDKPLPPRIRGTNVVIGRNDVDPAVEVPRWAGWGANVVRALVNLDDGAPAPTPASPLLPYRKNLARLDAIVERSRASGLKVVVAADGVWGRANPAFWGPLGGRLYRSHVVQFWRAVADRYRSDPTVVGYDVLNEPDPPDSQADAWYTDLLVRSISAIREQDASTWVVVEPRRQDAALGLARLPPLSTARVVYSIHDYAPRTFTHQGVAESCPRGPAYPGPAAHPYCHGSPVVTWDKERLRGWLQPAVAFQRQRRARIYIGEFGAARWAPGAARWLADQISLFEEYGFDWSFFGTANYNGFNPTFDAHDPVSGRAYGGKVTDRLTVLLDGWARNRTSPPPG